MGDAAYKKRHRELGLCVCCSKPALSMMKKCAEHTYTRKATNKKYYYNNHDECLRVGKKTRQGYRDSGRCIGCGNLLDEDADEGRVACMNCRSREYRGMIQCR
jgi:DNA-directed RNA polymerase subunit RPC12/RpoP